MKKLFIFSMVFIFSQNLVMSQLVGDKYIPGSGGANDYANIAAAINAINLQGVGAGGVTFNISNGYTENTTSEILITATATLGNPIIFQKSGIGNNPKITRTDAGTITTSAYGGNGDAVIRISGGDYISFDGIDVSADQSSIEYGYYTFKPTGIDGCKNITIKNCNITMNKGTTNTYVTGIYISNGPTSVGSWTGITVTNVSGINENILIINNVISNVSSGVHLRGSTAQAYYDKNIILGQSGNGSYYCFRHRLRIICNSTGQFECIL
jgi:hypothetical protein